VPEIDHNDIETVAETLLKHAVAVERTAQS
jgi:hypothetical protein